jgi:hypothetical protein
MHQPVTAVCLDCGVELAADSPDFRVELTDDDQLYVWCEQCWVREFGELTEPERWFPAQGTRQRAGPAGARSVPRTPVRVDDEPVVPRPWQPGFRHRLSGNQS